ncbi:alanine racemase [Paraneptunicella aestuarii]|uniref:alanine racemase n=1 Tax=Paraneptunicella aestuarii TaxID=2831148 RepID=UPI001E40F0F5|nr:alanine racemase [Paraneptunicella aestuarii]UAA37683.1 alanine racemase [Paraneptunicella aestuarii]
MALIENLPTPSLLVEHERLQHNIAVMKAKANRFGVSLRAHLKTAKSLDIAAMLCDSSHSGITVSTLQEAEYFAAGGYKDILYAVCLEPRKFERVARLYARGISLKVIVNDMVVAQQLVDWSNAQQAWDFQIQCLIEIDTDGHRTGIAPDSEDLLPMGQLLDSAQNIEFCGVMTHCGSSYNCHSLDCIKNLADLEREGCVLAAHRLREAGIKCDTVSVGSTPTMVVSENFEEVTEIRPGVFVFYDLFQYGLGVCSLNDIALSVLSAVIGHNRRTGKIFLDAGGLALSKDRGTAGQNVDYGYGLVCNLQGQVIQESLIVEDVNQEHGIVSVSDDSLFERFPIGSLVRILPNHACMTAAAYEYYEIVKQGKVIDRWSRCNGWNE